MTETGPAPTQGVPPNSAWKPRFFIIWTGQALSLVGSALTQFVLLWYITDTTNSASALAVAGMLALLPQAVLGLLGGTFADRWSRRLIMIVADAVTALCILVLVALFAAGQVQLWHIYALLFVRSCMQAFQQPAASASTAMLVPTEWLQRVGGMNQAVFGLMSIAGAPLGALALSLLPLQGALLIDVVTALLGIVPLFFFTIPQIFTAPSEQASVWSELVDGVRYVGSHRSLLLFSLVIGLVVLTIMPSFSLTPLFVKQWFRGGVTHVAVMEAVSGVGLILGGVIIGVWPGFKRRVVTVLVFFALTCLAVALAALAPPTLFALGAFWWFVCGAAVSIGNGPFFAILQTIVPNQMQGRVLALFNTVNGLAGPVGLMVAGPLAEVFGVRPVFVIGGLLSALVCCAALFSPTLLRLEAPRPELAA